MSHVFPSRRELLLRVGGGFAGLALLDLLSRDGFFANVAHAAPSPLAPKPPHFKAKAKHAIFLFMNGGPRSGRYVRPAGLEKYDGKPYTGR